MSSKTDIAGLIEQIHQSPLKLVIVSSGGGTDAIASLLKVPGASKTVLESYIPYARESLAYYLLKEPDQYCSLDTTLSMAAKAFQKAKKIMPKTDPKFLLGISVTASLVTTYKKMGEHKFYITLQTESYSKSISCVLDKGKRTRNEEEDLVSAYIFMLINEACELDSSKPDHDETAKITTVNAEKEWIKLKQNKINFVIANGENAAGGFGITENICNELYSYGVNVITTGNHLWDQKEITSYIDKDQNLLKPYNFAEGSPGLGFNIYELANKEKIAVINIMGNLFMRSCDNAFFKIEEVLQKIDVNDLSFIFVDFHAEASSEKMAMGHHLDGRVTAVVGTHTHVPTADANSMEHGTAYQTDAGMCGDYDSVIGMNKENSLNRFMKEKSIKPFL